MGIDGDIRDILERVARECFFPQVEAHTGKFVYPDIKNFSAFVDDLNARIRSMGLIHPRASNPKPWHCRLWGEVFVNVGIQYAEAFAAGLREGRITVDCNTPPNKAKAQATRAVIARRHSSAELNGSGSSAGKKRARIVDADGNVVVPGEDPRQQESEPADPKAHYYKWPADREGEECTWFNPDTPVQCSWEEVCYSDDPRVKPRFTEAITRYLIEEMPLPPDCSIVLDCCVRNGVWIRRPIRIQIVHPYDRDAVDNEFLYTLAKSGQPGIMRVARFDPNLPTAHGYGEADDRIGYHVNDLTVRCGLSTVVFSIDGDTDVALVNTLNARRAVQREGPNKFRIPRGNPLPMVAHAMPRLRQLIQPDGRTRDLCDTIVIDTDRLAVFLECHYGGMALHCQEDELEPRIIDGTAIFALLATMRDTDYTESYPFMSAANIFEAVERQPRMLVDAIDTYVCEHKEVLGPFRLLDCRIHVEPFIKFISYAANLARTNGSSQCRAPTEHAVTSAAAAKRKEPPNEKDKRMTIAGVKAMIARMVWLWDKYVNGGIPGYILPNPFATNHKTGKSLYGYKQKLNPRTNRQEVIFTTDVHPCDIACIDRS